MEPALPEVRARAWIAWNDGASIGPGRAALLQGIERWGSIARAAQGVGVSYRTAWKWIRTMNRAARQPLVVAATGGPGGGGARLTEVGEAVLRAHLRLDEALRRFVELANAELREVLAGLPGPASRRGRQ